MQVVFLIMLFIIGSCAGSFLCCQARRLKLRESLSKKDLKFLKHRSVCLSCKYQLKWYDNIPIISWLLLRGKCRKCKKKIGKLEFLSEIGTGIAFLLIGTTIDITTTDFLPWVIFVFVVLLTLALSFLAIYDGAYGELPTFALFFSIIFALAIAALTICQQSIADSFDSSFIINPCFAVLILGGIYLGLFIISKGKWIGDGDWILGTAIAIALGLPWLALIVLFLSNLLACLVMFPLMKGKYHKKIHFGPFLVAAFVIVFSFANFFISMI